MIANQNNYRTTRTGYGSPLPALAAGPPTNLRTSRSSLPTPYSPGPSHILSNSRSLPTSVVGRSIQPGGILSGELKAPKKPERPLSAYMRFNKRVHEKVKAENPNLKVWDTAKLLGQMWRELPENEKQVYIDEYELEKRQYNEAIKQYLASPAYLTYQAAKARRDNMAMNSEDGLLGSAGDVRMTIAPACDDEDLEEDGFAYKHLAAARFHRNNRLIQEIFNDHHVPDGQNIVTNQRLDTLKQQAESLKEHYLKFKADLDNLEVAHEAKKLKICQQSESFQKDMKVLLDHRINVTTIEREELDEEKKFYKDTYNLQVEVPAPPPPVLNKQLPPESDVKSSERTLSKPNEDQSSSNNEERHIVSQDVIADNTVKDDQNLADNAAVDSDAEVDNDVEDDSNDDEDVDDTEASEIANDTSVDEKTKEVAAVAVEDKPPKKSEIETENKESVESLQEQKISEPNTEIENPENKKPFQPPIYEHSQHPRYPVYSVHQTPHTGNQYHQQMAGYMPRYPMQTYPAHQKATPYNPVPAAEVSSDSSHEYNVHQQKQTSGNYGVFPNPNSAFQQKPHHYPTSESQQDQTQNPTSVQSQQNPTVYSTQAPPYGAQPRMHVPTSSSFYTDQHSATQRMHAPTQTASYNQQATTPSVQTGHMPQTPYMHQQAAYPPHAYNAGYPSYVAQHPPTCSAYTAHQMSSPYQQKQPSYMHHQQYMHSQTSSSYPHGAYPSAMHSSDRSLMMNYQARHPPPIEHSEFSSGSSAILQQSLLESNDGNAETNKEDSQGVIAPSSLPSTINSEASVKCSASSEDSVKK